MDRDDKRIIIEAAVRKALDDPSVVRVSNLFKAELVREIVVAVEPILTDHYVKTILHLEEALAELGIDADDIQSTSKKRHRRHDLSSLKKAVDDVAGIIVEDNAT